MSFSQFTLPPSTSKNASRIQPPPLDKVYSNSEEAEIHVKEFAHRNGYSVSHLRTKTKNRRAKREM
ncbi:hypothetical protein PsorP6_016525 [Peronosclerospora sorghi]|uniref:Uncharacterized protein n=1 Tax=Peronosclerospora sorghi TaxID=230839 RepID=A0ACC0VKD1_9STRA|nr:hypothetical protein PsorP6_016525 [Peronosclerospora sorghi]